MKRAWFVKSVIEPHCDLRSGIPLILQHRGQMLELVDNMVHKCNHVI